MVRVTVFKSNGTLLQWEFDTEWEAGAALIRLASKEQLGRTVTFQINREQKK